jgi:transcriptional regulator with XRE-family HTH domain
MGAEEAVLAAFGRAVRQRRNELGISQEELAFRTGLHRTYIGGVERGERNVGLINVVRIAEGLEMVPSALAKSVDQPRSPRRSETPGR